MRKKKRVTQREADRRKNQRRVSLIEKLYTYNKDSKKHKSKSKKHSES